MNKIQNPALFIILLLVSLQSYYFPALRMAPLPLLAAIAFLVLARDHLWSSLRSGRGVTLLGLIGLSGAVALYHTHRLEPLRAVAAMALGIVVFLCARAHTNSRSPKTIRNAFFWLIALHLMVWWIHFLGFQVFELRLDFFKSITGEVQRTDRITDIPHFFLFRASGLFTEPAMYCSLSTAWVACFLIQVRASGERLIRSERWLLTFFVVSVVLTFCLTGWIGLCSLLFLWPWKDEAKTFAKVVLPALGLILGLTAANPHTQTSFFVSFSRVKNVKTDPSARERVQGIGSQSSQSLPGLSFLGEGLGNYSKVKGESGGFRFFVRYFGFFLGTLFILVLVFPFSLSEFIVLALYLGNAPFVLYPAFWLYLGLAAHRDLPKAGIRPMANS